MTVTLLTPRLAPSHTHTSSPQPFAQYLPCVPRRPSSAARHSIHVSRQQRLLSHTGSPHTVAGAGGDACACFSAITQSVNVREACSWRSFSSPQTTAASVAAQAARPGDSNGAPRPSSTAAASTAAAPSATSAFWAASVCHSACTRTQRLLRHVARLRWTLLSCARAFACSALVFPLRRCDVAAK